MIDTNYKLSVVFKWLTEQLNTFETESGKYEYTYNGNIIYQKLSNKIYNGDDSKGMRFVWIEYTKREGEPDVICGATSTLVKYMSGGRIPSSNRKPMYDVNTFTVFEGYFQGQQINAILGRRPK